MPNLNVDYNSLPDQVKAYVDASEQLSNVVKTANEGLQGVQYEGSSGDVLRGAQDEFSVGASQTLTTSSEDQSHNAQVASDNMSSAEADVTADSAKVSDMGSDIKL